MPASKISKHAVERYREYTGSKKPEQRVRDKMLRNIAHQQPAKLSPAQNVKQLMNHRYKPAKYYKAHGLLYVVVDDTIITVHRNESRRW